MDETAPAGFETKTVTPEIRGLQDEMRQTFESFREANDTRLGEL